VHIGTIYVVPQERWSHVIVYILKPQGQRLF